MGALSENLSFLSDSLEYDSFKFFFDSVLQRVVSLCTYLKLHENLQQYLGDHWQHAFGAHQQTMQKQ